MTGCFGIRYVRVVNEVKLQKTLFYPSGAELQSMSSLLKSSLPLDKASEKEEETKNADASMMFAVAHVNQAVARHFI